MGNSGSGLPMPPDPIGQAIGGAMGGATGGSGTSSGTSPAGGVSIDQGGVLQAALAGQIDKSGDLSKQSTKPLSTNQQPNGQVPPQVNPDEQDGTSQW